MVVDIILVLLLVGVIFRGREAGLVRQVCSIIGFVAGLYVGAALQPYVLQSVGTTLSRALLSVGFTIACALVLLSAGEFVGQLLKLKLHKVLSLNKADAYLGSVAGVISLVLAVWLLTPAISSYPSPELRQAMKSSAIIRQINRVLPSSPQFIARIGNLINPNGFPDVFAGLEPEPSRSNAPLPSVGDFAPTVSKDRASVVKLEGKGCGGIVEGSGFVAAQNYVITNAHVVAGVSRPTVIDGNGRHTATPVWFDPDLDVAVLEVDGLAGNLLQTKEDIATNGSAAVVMGYPGGGDFQADPANVLDEFIATGRNIYGTTTTRRSVYELKADIIPGNSGGPLIDKDGDVIGLVFAQSTTYDQVGYALTIKPVMQEFAKAVAQNTPVSTSSCAE